MLGYCGGDNCICRLPGWASTEKKSEQTRQCMWSAASVIWERDRIIVWTVILLYALMGVLTLCHKEILLRLC